MGRAIDSERTKRKILAALVQYGPMPVREISMVTGFTIAVIHTHKRDLLADQYIAEQDLGEKHKGANTARYIYRALKEDYRSVTPAEVVLANPVSFYNPFRKNPVVNQGVNL